MKVKLVEISFDYGTKLTEEELNIALKYATKIRFKTLEDFQGWNFDRKTEEEKIEINDKYQKYLIQERKEIEGYSDSFIVDINLFIQELPLVKFKVHGTREVEIEAPSDSFILDKLIHDNQQALNSMMSLFQRTQQRIAELHVPETLNQQCNVHIGGGLLMTVNDLLLLEDSCTDKLQEALNSGWRILSVCVQADGRRPDYVLGRYNPKMNIDGHANRRI